MVDLGDGLASDMTVAAAWVAPLLALNALIMLPNWSSWALPKLDAEERRAAASTPPSPIPLTRADAASAPPSPLIADLSPSTTSPTSLGDEPLTGGLSQAQTSELLGRLQRAAAAATAAGPDSGGRMVPASSWGKRETLSLKRVKDAFHLAQVGREGREGGFSINAMHKVRAQRWDAAPCVKLKLLPPPPPLISRGTIRLTARNPNSPWHGRFTVSTPLPPSPPIRVTTPPTTPLAA